MTTAASKLTQHLDIIATRIENLTPAQMHNAMINCDRMVQNFGKSWQEFRTWTFAKNGSQAHIWDDCTKEQMMAYVAHKRDMINQHKYLTA